MDNQQLFFAIFSLHQQQPWLTPIMVTVTKYSIYVVPFLAALIGFKGGFQGKKQWLLLATGVIFIYPITEIIKLIIQEPRPFVTFHLQPLITPPTDLSFPSGHTSLMSVIASTLFFARSGWFLLFAVFALLVGFSRVYVGVHYPTDVLGGFVLGFILVFCLKKILRV